MTSSCILSAKNLTARFGNRTLFQGLNLSMEREKVALIGRNGVGKSTLLQLLAKNSVPELGEVTHHEEVVMLSQLLEHGELSGGERRLRRLQEIFASSSGLLLLDEPSQDLDGSAFKWLKRQMEAWPKALLVASHDRRLLTDFRHFFVMAESGCRYFEGNFEDLEASLEEDFRQRETRYMQALSRAAREEEKAYQVARRRRRKQQYGRVRELDRATPKSTLNHKRGAAQVSHGRINKRRQRRLEEVRKLTKSARRSLKVNLALEIELRPLPEENPEPVIWAQNLIQSRGSKPLFRDLEFSLRRERVGLVGANGSGKTSLIKTLLGELSPEAGSCHAELGRIGVIHQGAKNWRRGESLIQLLSENLPSEQIGESLLASGFPLALAERSLASLSPGERVRAALLALLLTDNKVEFLVLDEPNNGLDLLGQKSLRSLLRAWKGGLLVASHDEEFLQAIGCQEELRLT